jgi:hypothetical protein
MELFAALSIRTTVCNATFNNISVVSWWSVLLVEETGETTDLPQFTDKLNHILVYYSKSKIFFIVGKLLFLPS